MTGPVPDSRAALDSVRAVVFDLDGTLIDSRRDLARAVNVLREEMDLRPLGVERVVSFVGHGVKRLVERALEDGSEGFDPAGFDPDRAVARFLEIYYGRCLETTVPYPGVPEMLARLDEGFPLALLTNKPERHTRKILARLDGLVRALGERGSRLRAVIGGDTLATRKPDPEGLLRIAGELGLPVERVLMVGDSAIDGATARAAGAPLALVRWGFGSDEELAAFEPVLRLATPGELVSALI